MPVATPRRHHAPRTQKVQPNAVHKYEAPWGETEHQAFHQSACDVFRHRRIHVDARTSDRCATPHTIRCQRDLSPPLQLDCRSVRLRSTERFYASIQACASLEQRYRENGASFRSDLRPHCGRDCTLAAYLCFGFALSVLRPYINRLSGDFRNGGAFAGISHLIVTGASAPPSVRLISRSLSRA